jgi:TonB family protein
MRMTRHLLALALLAAAGCASAPRADCGALTAQLGRGERLRRPDGGAFEERTPRPRNRGRIERMAEDGIVALGLDTIPRAAMLRLRVTAAGAPEGVRIVQSSGSAAFDSIAVWAMGQGQFVPATLDGCPVSVFVEVPMTGPIPRSRRPAPPREPAQP